MTIRIRTQHGFGTAAKILSIPIAFFVLLILLFTFYEGRKIYWDGKVKEMCEKDGGVLVFEHITLTSEEYKRLGGVRDGLPIPAADDSRSKDYPYFREVRQSKIRGWNPEVVRLETIVKRRSDQKAIGRSIYYFRRGGDVPTGLFHESSFGCPAETRLAPAIFRISGG